MGEKSLMKNSSLVPLILASKRKNRTCLSKRNSTKLPTAKMATSRRKSSARFSKKLFKTKCPKSKSITLWTALIKMETDGSIIMNSLTSSLNWQKRQQTTQFNLLKIRQKINENPFSEFVDFYFELVRLEMEKLE